MGRMMRKRKWMIGIGILVVCVLTGVLAMFCLKQYRLKQAVRIYQEFIEGKRTAGGVDIKEILFSKDHPEWPLDVTYSMVDVTGDGIPELHIYGARCEYWIFSVEDGDMYYLAGFNSYMSKYHLLNNGAFLFRADDRHDYGVHYKYFELDDAGESVNEVYFSWVSKDTDYWRYQEKDIYEFDGKTCTYEEWYALTRKYLRLTLYGGEEVRNEAEWIRYFFKE